MIYINEENLKILIHLLDSLIKSTTPQLFVAYYIELSSDISKFFSQDLTEIRHELLSLQGIGPEQQILYFYTQEITPLL